MPPEEVESLLRSNRAGSDEKEVKELLRIDVKTVYSYAQRGLLPYVKIRSNLRFVKREIVKRIIMADDGGNSLMLLFAKRTVELDFNRRSKQALILHDGLDSMSIEQCDQLRDATSGESQVPSHILAATNDSRLVENGAPHSLRFVELWILNAAILKIRFMSAGGKSFFST